MAPRRKTIAITTAPCVKCAHATLPEDPRMDGFLRCQLALGFFVSTTHPRQCPRFENAG